MRIDFDPQLAGRGGFYRLLTAVVVPRPIAWVSTVSADGTANLAPHSFFTIACVEPPIVQFTSVGRKDTLVNVEETREFVVCVAPESMAAEVNATATDYPRGTDEFAAVGVAAEASARVRPPRVAGSPVALECVLHSTVLLGDSTLVLGRVVHAAVAEEVVVDGHPDSRLMKPLSRLGRNEWGTVGALHDIPRIPFSDTAR
jgi:flavin reductase (DIM6/NTAB) family NADH-FMN oxidoreductase RutF